MIFGPEYSADYIEGFNAGRASAELVCSERHAFLESEVEGLRAELAFANDCLTKASGYLANEPSRRCWCGR